MEIQAQGGAWLMLQLQNWQDGKVGPCIPAALLLLFPLYCINIDPRDKNGHPGPASRKSSWIYVPFYQH